MSHGLTIVSGVSVTTTLGMCLSPCCRMVLYSYNWSKAIHVAEQAFALLRPFKKLSFFTKNKALNAYLCATKKFV